MSKPSSRKLSLLLTLLLIIIILLTVGTPAWANSYYEMYVNGEKVSSDVPFRKHGEEILGPLRAFAESLDLAITWDAEAREINYTDNETTVVMSVDSKTATVNGEPVEMDAAPSVIEGRTMVPARFIVDVFGYTEHVEFVEIDEEDFPSPPPEPDPPEDMKFVTVAMYVYGEEVETGIPRWGKYSGELLGPVRAFAESLDLAITWDAEAREIEFTNNETTVVMTVDSKTATVNGEPVEMDAAPSVIEGRTMVPARFIVDVFGYTEHVEFKILSELLTLSIEVEGQGSTEPAAGVYSIYESNQMTLNATPDQGYEFKKWTENGTEVSTSTSYTFTVTEDRSLTAHFIEEPDPPSPSPRRGGAPPARQDDDDDDDNGSEPDPEPDPELTPAVIGREAIQTETSTREDGKTVETHTVSDEVKEQLANARAEGKTAIDIQIDDSEADVTAVKVSRDILQSAAGMDVAISTHQASLELPRELVQALDQGDQDLTLEVESGDSEETGRQMADLPEAANANVLDTPRVINTPIQGNTHVTLPLRGIDFPEDTAEKQAFLDDLRVFAVHSDGEKKVIEGTITYDDEGNPAGIRFTVDRFSTFAVISVPPVEEAAPVDIKLTIDHMEAEINGESYILDAEPFVKPEVYRTLVPVRFIGEALGVKVTWMAEERQVVLEDEETTIILTIDSDEVLVNDETKTLDCPAEVLPPGRTFVPLRFISETLGAQVDYVHETREIFITR